MSKRWKTILFSIPVLGSLLFTNGCDYTGAGPDPARARYDDPPVIYAFLNGVGGHQTAVRIAFSPYTNTYTVTSPSGFTFLRQSAPGMPMSSPRHAGVSHGQSVFPPDPDEFQFDPWDIPLPEDDFPMPDPPLPDPFEDPWDDLPPPPPLPPDEMDSTDFSPGTLDISTDGTPLGYGIPRIFKSPLAPRAAYSVRAIVPVGPGAAGLVTSPDKKTIYVAVSGAANIAVVDRAAAKVTSRINFPAGASPYSLAITPDGSRLYAGEFTVASASLYSIDLPSGKVTSLPTAGSVISQMLVTPDGTQVWVCNYFGNSVSIFDVLTNSYVGQIQIAYPWSVAFNPAGTRVYVANGTPSAQGAVTVYDTASLKMIASIPAGNTPRMIRVTPSGRHAFVTHYDSAFISQIDLFGNTLVRNIPVPGTGGSGLTFKHQ